jgi:hypothetical protein
MEPQQRRPRPDLGCSAIGWMDYICADIDPINQALQVETVDYEYAYFSPNIRLVL